MFCVSFYFVWIEIIKSLDLFLLGQYIFSRRAVYISSSVRIYFTAGPYVFQLTFY